MAVNVPQSARLSQLFSTLQASHELLRVQECSVTQTTLEQVFCGGPTLTRNPKPSSY